jgi:hypothetical protein
MGFGERGCTGVRLIGELFPRHRDENVASGCWVFVESQEGGLECFAAWSHVILNSNDFSVPVLHISVTRCVTFCFGVHHNIPCRILRQ